VWIPAHFGKIFSLTREDRLASAELGVQPGRNFTAVSYIIAGPVRDGYLSWVRGTQNVIKAWSP
jgi:hypothetical protein